MLKVGIIGCGGICNGAHLPAYNKKNSRAKVVALCDINEAKFDKTEKKLGYKPKRYTDYKQMIENEQLDYVDICTPNYLHAEIAIFAMEHKVNVFTEKPDTISVEKVLEMQRVQQQTGVHLMAMRNNRYWPSVKQLKKAVDKGEYGQLYTGRCGWIRKRGIPGKGGWFTTKSQSGGGPLIDLGVHMIDLAVYLMGNPKAVSVSGCTYSKFSNCDESVGANSNFGEKVENGIFDVEDLATGFIKFDNGASLQIEFSWASNIKREKTFVELRGEKKGFSWSNGTYESYDGRHYKPLSARLKRLGQYAAIREGNHRANLEHFMDVLENKAEPNYEISQGVNMIKILCAMYESADTGKEVTL